jgi:hypothetical protein
MATAIKYYYNQDSLKDAHWGETHGRITSLLHGLKESGRIANLTIEELRKAFPTRDVEQQLFDRLMDFSIRHHVGLARAFGSKRHGFCYLPSQFLLVLEDGELKEVFPHEVDRISIDVLSFLEPFARGEPWTEYFVPPGRKTKHEDLVEKIVVNPAILEPELELTGRNVHLSRDFSETGYVDLVFRDKEGRHLLVEIKVKPNEFDKAIGQILKHRELFAAQNFIDKNRVRIGIASPFIAAQSRTICKMIGIACFELGD